RGVVGNFAQPLFQLLLAFQALAVVGSAVCARLGCAVLAVVCARIDAVGCAAISGQSAGTGRAAAGGARVLARGWVTGAIGWILGAGTGLGSLHITIAGATFLAAILRTAAVTVHARVRLGLLLLLLFAELLQKVLQRIAVMPCTLVCRVQGQGMFVGFQCSGIVTGHGQSGAAIEKIFRVVRLYMAERCPLLGGGGMIASLVQGPGTPFGIAKALGGRSRLLLRQQLHGLLVRPLPEIGPAQGQGVLWQQYCAEQHSQPAPAAAQRGNRQQQQHQPMTVVNQQYALAGGG